MPFHKRRGVDEFRAVSFTAICQSIDLAENTTYTSPGSEKKFVTNIN
jgi:hypothetical protein